MSTCSGSLACMYVFTAECVLWVASTAPICSFLRGAAGGGFGRGRGTSSRCSRRGIEGQETRAEEGGSPPPFSSPSSFSSSPHPLPPLLVVDQQHIRVRSHGRRPVQPCEGCQGHYGDIYWGRGISQLAILKLFYASFDWVEG